MVSVFEMNRLSSRRKAETFLWFLIWGLDVFIDMNYIDHKK